MEVVSWLGVAMPEALEGRSEFGYLVFRYSGVSGFDLYFGLDVALWEVCSFFSFLLPLVVSLLPRMFSCEVRLTQKRNKKHVLEWKRLKSTCSKSKNKELFTFTLIRSS